MHTHMETTLRCMHVIMSICTHMHTMHPCAHTRYITCIITCTTHMHNHMHHTCKCTIAQKLPGKAGGALRGPLLSNLRLRVRQWDDIVVVTLIGLHRSVQHRTGVQWGSNSGKNRQTSLGTKYSWVVAPQELLIHLLVLLQGEARIRYGQDCGSSQ